MEVSLNDLLDSLIKDAKGRLKKFKSETRKRLVVSVIESDSDRGAIRDARIVKGAAGLFPLVAFGIESGLKWTGSYRTYSGRVESVDGSRVVLHLSRQGEVIPTRVFMLAEEFQGGRDPAPGDYVRCTVFPPADGVPAHAVGVVVDQPGSFDTDEQERTILERLQRIEAFDG